ncbi:MAG: NUDIX hydrolase [Ardenticatenaceae bacterium]|nr:NUDIX hydrolase [Ardenticatenaceae bacterium]
MSSSSQWLNWAKALQAISQTGLHFNENQYDRERYEQIANIAAEMMGAYSDTEPAWIRNLFDLEYGYATPKVDVRGVALREGQVLLVREIADQGRWTLPGGWADVNDSPAEAVRREMWEESGFEVDVRRVLAVYDREKQGHLPPAPYHIYKLFFHCEITGGRPTPNAEASEVAFFPPDALPELSLARVLPHQIQDAVAMIQNGRGPTRFD